eukprot:CAMPEP_0171174484 /NCGR_PEP_ID=MMETSP0790-20130122/10751_1 /TAXON_ID=2925 /ORGANISM="Alexandrium catenella, Strain OF101" /LENGTH=473 /DNA_ID=CAMNT_0011639359 /DNA_START=61 /DNA_END=1482 /DNA_ORIENTATION=+
MGAARAAAVGVLAIALGSGPTSALLVQKEPQYSHEELQEFLKKMKKDEAAGLIPPGSKAQRDLMELQEKMDKNDRPWRYPTGLAQKLLEYPTQTARVNLDSALGCLRQTTPDLHLEYPEDAEQHVEEIRKAMLPWSKGFVGSFHPEDMLNLAFADMWDNREDKSMRLSQFFGPYIPIFTQWVDPWLRNNESRLHYPHGFINALRGVLRKDVPYLAMSQNDEGLVGKGELAMAEYPNLLVLSGGGYGHVVMPLVQTQGRTAKWAKEAYDRGIYWQVNRTRIPERPYFMSYVGSMIHAPEDMRERMQAEVLNFVQKHGILDRPSLQVKFYHVNDKRDKSWQQVMFDSRFSLAPRGYGRTSYHVAEVIQRGLIPIQVYTDMPWVPFPKVFEKIGYTTDIAGLPTLLEHLWRLSDDEVREREEAVVAATKSHFNADAVMEQMKAFFLDGPTDLVCQRLPDSVTGRSDKRNMAGVPSL